MRTMHITPRLFPSTATTFGTQGLGALTDIIEGEVVEEIGGMYELTFDYPVDGIHYEDLRMRRIIYANPTPYANPQPFRIYNISKPIDMIVTVSAEHISYDLSGTIVPAIKMTSAKQALTEMKLKAITSCPFTFSSSVNKTATMETDKPKSIRALLGGEFLETYGGEFKFDHFNVSHSERRGYTKTEYIRYGKNMIDVTQEENCNNVFTGVYPYYSYNDTGDHDTEDDNKKVIITLPEKIVRAEGTFDFERISPLDASQAFDDPPTVDQLREWAVKWVEENNIGVPKIQLSVVYTPAVGRMEVELGDKVNIEFLKLGIKAKARCVSTSYNLLTDEYNSVDFGEAQSSLASTMVESNKEIKDTVANEFIKFGIEVDNIKIGFAQIEELVAGKVDADYLEANYAKLTNGYIDNAVIKDASIGTAKIEDASITVAKIQDAFIDNLVAEQGKFDSAHIGVLTSDNIDADTITAEHIQASVIDAINMNVEGKISADRIDTSTLVVDEIDASKITTGTLDADRIGAGTITANKLTLTDLTNLAVLVDEQSKVYEVKGKYTQLSKLLHGSDVANGDEYLMEVLLKSRPENGMSARFVIKVDVPGGMYEPQVVLCEASQAVNTTKFSGKVKINVPSNIPIKSVSMWLRINTSEDDPVIRYEMSQCVIRKLNNAKMIVDGSITANKIAAGTITGDKIEGGTITGDKIEAGAIDTEHLSSGSITAEKIETGSITADKMNAETVEAIGVTASDITAEKIASGEIKVGDANIVDGTISGAKISKASITSAEISDLFVADAYINEIVADKIKGGTLDAANITVTHLNAASITVGKINGTQIAGGSVDWDHLTGDLEDEIRQSIADAGLALDEVGDMTTIVNGKNTIFYGPTAPAAGTAHQNDTWFDTDNGNKMYRYESNIWREAMFDTAAIAAGAITADKIATGTIVAGNISTGTITGDKMTALTITGDKIAGATITAGKLAADSVTAGNIAAGAVDADSIVAKAIDSSKIDTEELFVGGNAFITKLKAVEIDASNITTGTISGERIDITGLVSFEDLDGDMERHFSVNAGKTYINGDTLTTNSIKADKLDLYSGINVMGPDNTPTFSVSDEGEVVIDGLLMSQNFGPETGYRIDTDGNTTFNQAVIRGDVILPNAGLTNYTGKDETPNLIPNTSATIETVVVTTPYQRTMWAPDTLADGGISINDKLTLRVFLNPTQVDQPDLKDANTATFGQFLNADGSWGTYSQFRTSDYIRVTPTHKYRAIGFTHLGNDPATCFYDKNYVYLSGIRNGGSANHCELVTAPPSAAFMRICWFADDDATHKIIEDTTGCRAEVEVFTSPSKSNSVVYKGNTIAIGESGYSTVTFDVDTTVDAGLHVILRNISNSAGSKVTVGFKELKLEKGDAPTPYSISPIGRSVGGAAVRIWAGASYEERNLAPFRVDQDGNVFASNGTFEGLLRGILDSGDVQINNNSLTVHAPGTENEVIALTGANVKMNTYVNIGDGSFVYNDALNLVDIRSNFHMNHSNTVSGVNVHYDHTGGWGSAFALINPMHEDNRVSFGYTNTGVRHNTLIIAHGGAPGGEFGDVSFRTVTNERPIKVTVEGELNITHKITGHDNAIEMRVIDDGWAFYAR